MIRITSNRGREFVPPPPQPLPVDDRRPLEITCPACGADMWASCRSPQTGKKIDFHAARKRAMMAEEA